MRKVFSTLFLLGLFMPGVASAATNPLYTTTPNGRCYGVINENYEEAKSGVEGGYVEDCTFRIFFKNDDSNIYGDDPGCIDELKQKLNDALKNAPENGYVYLLGMTDSLAKERHNINLATSRVKTVENLIASLSNATKHERSFYVSGRSQALGYSGGTGKNSQPVMRSVCVLINQQIPNDYKPEPITIDITQRTATQVKIGVDFTQDGGQDTALANINSNINSTVSKIKSLSDAIGRSVWKDKEGGFNTSRLVSDSVAGVVLGTAGGLIVSHVVKKNQVKHGLEGMHCTVGGQVVADHGDDFIVGIN